jgi:hypothetical protein
MSTSTQPILEFCELAVARRKRPLSPEDRSRIDSLEVKLRDLIDGARPAPRQIEGKIATPVKAATTPSKAPAPGPPVPSAPVVITPAQPTKQNVKALAEKLEISSNDRKKMSDVNAEDLPVSAYTRSLTPAFLSDYYSDDIEPIEIERNAKLSAMVRADDGELDILQEVKVLFGFEKPRPIRVPNDRTNDRTTAEPRAKIVAPQAAAARAAAAPVDDAAASRMPVIVHLLAGGTRRGTIEWFDPSSSALDFYDDAGAQAQIDFEGVLAVFFGQKRGDEPTMPTGQKVIVRLVNDRQVAGLTEDYQEGGDSLTLVPEQRRGNVDRVWIPAWAVKEIHLG